MVDDVLPSRRERLVNRRRRLRVHTAVWIAALVLVAGGAAFALWARPEPASSNNDAVDRDVASPPVSLTPDDLPSLRDVSEDAPPRVVSHDDPLRLWVGGDSLAGALGPALGGIAGATGVVDTEVDYRVSSGLASDGVRDWSRHAEEALAEDDPEAVVFVIGTNDASIVGRSDDDGTVPEWEARYRVEVARMMDLLVGDDPARTVFWVGAPTMRTGWRDRGVVELNRIMREEAQLRKDDVVYVDAYELFGGEDGFSESLTTFGGETERVRVDDGVHFTGAGAEYLATAVFALLDARWDIWDHADPDNPIRTEIARGSGGGSSGGSSSGGSGGSAGSGGTSSSSPAVTSTSTPTGETTTTVSVPLETSTSVAATTAPSTVAPSSSAPTVTTAAPTTTGAPATTTPPPSSNPPST